MANADLTEVSGLVASATQPGVLWVHNDSGDGPVIYAVGSDGADLGAFTVTGARAVDWEDIAKWTDPESGTPYLYLADTGDFHLPDGPGEATTRRDHVTVYRVEEPGGVDVDGAGGTTAQADVYEFTYPDGPFDSEAFIVDPLTGDFYFLTKGWDGSPAPVFRAAAPEPGGRTELAEVASISLDSRLDLITGADVANVPDDGTAAPGVDGPGAGRSGVVVVRTYTGVSVFPLTYDTDRAGAMAATFDAEPCAGASAIEAQGEAIAVAVDLSGYVTASEGAHPPLNWFPVGP